MIWPPKIPTAVMAKTSGVRTVPELVADCPRTPWTKSGVYRMIPNIPIPTKNISSAAEVKLRLLNRDRGMIGSSARSSHGTKTASRRAETTKPATTRVAPQS
jgi:hypothetical protein